MKIGVVGDVEVKSQVWNVKHLELDTGVFHSILHRQVSQTRKVSHSQQTATQVFSPQTITFQMNR